MKKFIAILALMIATFSASGQINKVTRVETSRLVKTARFGNLFLFCDKGIYTIKIQSSNQYDYLFSFHLGDNREQSILTLTDVIELIKNSPKNEIITFETPNASFPYKYCITKESRTSIHFLDTGRIGSVFISIGELNTMLNAIIEDVN